MVTHGRKIAEIHRIERVGAFGKKMIICFAFCIKHTLYVAIAAVRAFALLVLIYKGSVVRVNVTYP
jgi:hypothetical protein